MEPKQHITLKLAAHNVSLDIPRAQEQAYREAGDFLNRRYMLYSQRMPQASAEQIWLYVALEAALNWKTAAQSVSLEPVERKLETLNALIQDVLAKNADQTDNN